MSNRWKCGRKISNLEIHVGYMIDDLKFHWYCWLISKIIYYRCLKSDVNICMLIVRMWVCVDRLPHHMGYAITAANIEISLDRSHVEWHGLFAPARTLLTLFSFCLTNYRFLLFMLPRLCKVAIHECLSLVTSIGRRMMRVLEPLIATVIIHRPFLTIAISLSLACTLALWWREVWSWTWNTEATT